MRLFSFTNPPSGAIPRTPVWELTVMCFVVVYGFAGYFTADNAARQAVLGPWSDLWSLGVTACGIIALIGLAFPAPTGLLINLAGVLLLATFSVAVLVATVIYMNVLFYPGSTVLMIFAVGSVCRSWQLMGQLNRLRRRLAELADKGGAA